MSVKKVLAKHMSVKKVLAKSVRDLFFSFSFP
jgi:hypothetical protein